MIASADAILDTHLQAVELLRDPSHVRDYTVSEWISALSRSGFTVEGITHRKLRMEFAVWTTRTRACREHIVAIRSLQTGSPNVVRDHFAIGADGSFDLDTCTILVQADAH